MTRLPVALIVIAGNLAASDHLLKLLRKRWPGLLLVRRETGADRQKRDTVTVECVRSGTLNAGSAGLPADQVEADIRALYANPPRTKGPVVTR